MNSPRLAPRWVAFLLAAALSLPNPSFALRNQPPTESGLEEDLHANLAGHESIRSFLALLKWEFPRKRTIRVLDIGTGSGEFLLRLKALLDRDGTFRAELFGIDPLVPERDQQQPKQAGVTLIRSRVQDAQRSRHPRFRDPFDLVTVNALSDHELLSPRVVDRFVAPGGLVIARFWQELSDEALKRGVFYRLQVAGYSVAELPRRLSDLPIGSLEFSRLSRPILIKRRGESFRNPELQALSAASRGGLEEQEQESVPFPQVPGSPSTPRGGPSTRPSGSLRTGLEEGTRRPPWDTSDKGLVGQLPSIWGVREQTITDEKMIEKIVDPPLVEACKILFKKGIRTLASSANSGDRNFGAWIQIDPRPLSPENQAIAEAMTTNPKETGYLEKMNEHEWTLRIPFPYEATIGELSEKANALVNLFVSQTAAPRGGLPANQAGLEERKDAVEDEGLRVGGEDRERLSGRGDAVGTDTAPTRTVSPAKPESLTVSKGLPQLSPFQSPLGNSHTLNRNNALDVPQLADRINIAPRVGLEELTADEFEQGLIELFGFKVQQMLFPDSVASTGEVYHGSVEINGRRYPYTMSRAMTLHEGAPYFRAGEIFVLNKDLVWVVQDRGRRNEYEALMARYPKAIVLTGEKVWRGYELYIQSFFGPLGQEAELNVLPNAIGLLIAMQEMQSTIAGGDFVDVGSRSGLLAIAALKLGARHATLIEPDVPETYFVDWKTQERFGITEADDLIAANLKLNQVADRCTVWRKYLGDVPVTPLKGAVVVFDFPYFGMPYFNYSLSDKKLQEVGTTAEAVADFNAHLRRLLSDEEDRPSLIRDLLGKFPGTALVLAGGGESFAQEPFMQEVKALGLRPQFEVHLPALAAPADFDGFKVHSVQPANWTIATIALQVPRGGLEEIDRIVAESVPFPQVPGSPAASRGGPSTRPSGSLGAGLEERTVQQIGPAQGLISQWEIRSIKVGVYGEEGLWREPVEEEPAVLRIQFDESRTPLKSAEFQYDLLGQLRQLELDWTDAPAMVAEQTIPFGDTRILHFAYKQGVPFVWLSRVGSDEPGWVFSGYDLREKMGHRSGRAYVTISHYIDEKGNITPASESADHHEVFHFVERLVNTFGLDGEDIDIINHDLHPDKGSIGQWVPPVLGVGNWPAMLKHGRLVKRYLWVAARDPDKYMAQLGGGRGPVDEIVQDLSQLPSMLRGAHLIVTHDSDYYSSLPDTLAGEPATKEEILKKVRSVVDAYQAMRLRPFAINFTRSAFSRNLKPEFTPGGQSTFILNALVSEHQRLLGNVVLRKVPGVSLTEGTLPLVESIPATPGTGTTVPRSDGSGLEEGKDAVEGEGLRVTGEGREGLSGRGGAVDLANRPQLQSGQEAERTLPLHKQPTDLLPFRTPPLAVDQQRSDYQSAIQGQAEEERSHAETLTQHRSQDDSTQHGVTRIDDDFKERISLLGRKLHSGAVPQYKPTTVPISGQPVGSLLLSGGISSASATPRGGPSTRPPGSLRTGLEEGLDAGELAAIAAQIEKHAKHPPVEGPPIQIPPGARIVLHVAKNMTSTITFKVFNDVFRQLEEEKLIRPHVMVPFPIPDGDERKFGLLIRAVKQGLTLPNGAQVVMLNVGAPFKMAGTKWLDEKDPKTQGGTTLILRREDGQLWGTLNDGEAWVNWFKREYGSLSGRRVVILGVNVGSAIAWTMKEEGVQRLVVANLGNPQAAQRLARDLRLGGMNSQWVRQADDPERGSASSKLHQEIKRANVVINATGRGRRPDLVASPLVNTTTAPLKYRSDAIVVDLNLHLESENFLTQAAAITPGIRQADGVGMMVELNAMQMADLFGWGADDVRMERLRALVRDAAARYGAAPRGGPSTRPSGSLRTGLEETELATLRRELRGVASRERINRLMALLGWNQRRLAREAGVSKALIAVLLNHAPGYRLTEQTAEQLNVAFQRGLSKQLGAPVQDQFITPEPIGLAELLHRETDPLRQAAIHRFLKQPTLQDLRIILASSNSRERLLRLMALLGWNQRRLAQEAGVSHALISALLNHAPGYRLTEQVAKRLDTAFRKGLSGRLEVLVEDQLITPEPIGLAELLHRETDPLKQEAIHRFLKQPTLQDLRIILADSDSRERIQRLLTLLGWSLSKTAKRAGMSRTLLYAALNRYPSYYFTPSATSRLNRAFREALTELLDSPVPDQWIAPDPPRSDSHRLWRAVFLHLQARPKSAILQTTYTRLLEKLGYEGPYVLASRYLKALHSSGALVRIAVAKHIGKYAYLTPQVYATCQASLPKKRPVPLKKLQTILHLITPEEIVLDATTLQERLRFETVSAFREAFPQAKLPDALPASSLVVVTTPEVIRCYAAPSVMADIERQIDQQAEAFRTHWWVGIDLQPLPSRRGKFAPEVPSVILRAPNSKMPYDPPVPLVEYVRGQSLDLPLVAATALLGQDEPLVQKVLAMTTFLDSQDQRRTALVLQTSSEPPTESGLEEDLRADLQGSHEIFSLPDLLKAEFPHKRQLRILDVGTGYGTFLFDLKNILEQDRHFHPNLYGIDPLLDSSSQTNLGRWGIATLRISLEEFLGIWSQGNIADFGIDREPFDLVTINAPHWNTIEQLSHSVLDHQQLLANEGLLILQPSSGDGMRKDDYHLLQLPWEREGYPHVIFANGLKDLPYDSPIIRSPIVLRKAGTKFRHPWLQQVNDSEHHLVESVPFPGVSGSAAPRGGLEEIADSEFGGLASERGRALAEVLRGVLEEVEFNLFNQSIRQPDPQGVYMEYAEDPFPGVTSADAIAKIRSDWEERYSSHDFAIREREALEFFMLGNPLGRKELERVFGERYKDRIDEFIHAGLLAVAADGEIRMNNFSLASRELTHGQAIYILASTPQYFDKAIPSQRVYLGPDSYKLLDRLSKLEEVSGYVADLGSGSGIQLIAVAKLFPEVEKVIGLEIDAKARNLSLFNAYLNGVEDKVVVVSDEVGLQGALDGNRIALAIADPPFIAMPDVVAVDPEDAKRLAPYVEVVDGANGPAVDARQLYSKTGWGGPDGLSVTRQLLEVVLPLMAPGGKIIIYSQFAGDEHSVTKISEYLNAKGGLQFEFEPLPPVFVSDEHGKPLFKRVKLPIPVHQGKVLDWISYIRHQILQQNPLLGTPDLKPAIGRLIEKIAESFERQGITHFHDGHVVVTIKKGKTEPRIPQPGEKVYNVLGKLLGVVDHVEPHKQGDGHKIYLTNRTIVSSNLAHPAPPEPSPPETPSQPAAPRGGPSTRPSGSLRAGLEEENTEGVSLEEFRDLLHGYFPKDLADEIERWELLWNIFPHVAHVDLPTPPNLRYAFALGGASIAKQKGWTEELMALMMKNVSFQGKLPTSFTGAFIKMLELGYTQARREAIMRKAQEILEDIGLLKSPCPLGWGWMDSLHQVVPDPLRHPGFLLNMNPITGYGDPEHFEDGLYWSLPHQVMHELYEEVPAFKAMIEVDKNIKWEDQEHIRTDFQLEAIAMEAMDDKEAKTLAEARLLERTLASLGQSTEGDPEGPTRQQKILMLAQGEALATVRVEVDVSAQATAAMRRILESIPAVRERVVGSQDEESSRFYDNEVRELIRLHRQVRSRLAEKLRDTEVSDSTAGLEEGVSAKKVPIGRVHAERVRRMAAQLADQVKPALQEIRAQRRLLEDPEKLSDQEIQEAAQAIRLAVSHMLDALQTIPAGIVRATINHEWRQGAQLVDQSLRSQVQQVRRDTLQRDLKEADAGLQRMTDMLKALRRIRQVKIDRSLGDSLIAVPAAGLEEVKDDEILELFKALTSGSGQPKVLMDNAFRLRNIAIGRNPERAAQAIRALEGVLESQRSSDSALYYCCLEIYELAGAGVKGTDLRTRQTLERVFMHPRASDRTLLRAVLYRNNLFHQEEFAEDPVPPFEEIFRHLRAQGPVLGVAALAIASLKPFQLAQLKSTTVSALERLLSHPPVNPFVRGAALLALERLKPQIALSATEAPSAPAATHMVYIDDIPPETRESVFAQEIFSGCPLGPSRKFHPHNHEPELLLDLKEPHSSPYHVVLFGGILDDCLQRQVREIFEMVESQDEPTPVWVTLPLSAIYLHEGSGRDSLKYLLPEALALFSEPGRLVGFSAESFDNFQWRILLPDSIHVVIAKDGKVFREVHPEQSRTIVLNFVTTQEQTRRILELTGLEERTIAQIVAEAERATSGEEHWGRVVVVDTQALSEIERMVEVIAQLNALADRVIVFGESAAREELRQRLLARSRNSKMGAPRFASTLEALASELEDFVILPDVTVTLLGGSRELVEFLEKIVPELYSGASFHPIEKPTWISFWMGLGVKEDRAKEFAAGLEEQKLLRTGA